MTRKFSTALRIVGAGEASDEGVHLARMSHKSSTALRNTGTGADFVGFATLQGIDPASPAHRLETRTSTRSSFARYEFCETSGLGAEAPTPQQAKRSFERSDTSITTLSRGISQGRGQALSRWEGVKPSILHWHARCIGMTPTGMRNAKDQPSPNG